MRTYIARRFLQIIPLLFGISALTFLLLQLALDAHQVVREPIGTVLQFLQAQRGSDTGPQLTDAERLGEIVVRAGGQHLRHLIGRAGTREHDDLQVRRWRILPQLATNLHPRHARHVHVQ